MERFGIEKCKALDWELIDQQLSYTDIDYYQLLMQIDPNTEDINSIMYELVKDQIRPHDYSDSMKKVYPDRFFSSEEIKESSSDFISSLKHHFNAGDLSLKKIIRYWDFFQDKDLTLCLFFDSHNQAKITNDELKEFMSRYGSLAFLVMEYNDIYDFIRHIFQCENEEEEKAFVQDFTDGLLSESRKPREYGREPIRLTDEDYLEIFKYSSFEDFLLQVSPWYTSEVIAQLQELPEDFLETMPIPISVLFNFDVLSFIEKFGLKNIVDFDNECGQFFTRNHCEMLKLMNDMYLHYAGNEHDPKKSIYCE